MKTVKAIIEKATDGTYSIYHADVLPYAITSSGRTLEEAKSDFLNYYNETKTFVTSKGLEFEDVEWEWCFDTSSFIREFGYAFTLASLSRITGVSQGILSHYANGTSKPSKKTTLKIKEGISKFADQLSEIEFA